jgi:hypothetical protein
MAEIKCPVCGELNPDILEFCHYCHSRLQPLTGKRDGKDVPVQPAQTPAGKTAAEQHPVLPQWLSDELDRSCQSATEQAAQVSQTASFSGQSQDLLAGLQSQAEDEEELPDWLTNITGVASEEKEAGSEIVGVQWVESGAPKEFPHEETPSISATQFPTESGAEGSLPEWLAGSPAAQVGRDELSDWLAKAREEMDAEKPSTIPAADSSGLDISDQVSEPSPLWLKNLKPEQTAQVEFETVAPPGEPGTPRMAEPAAPGLTAPESSEADWLKRLQAQAEAPPIQKTAKPANLPPWLNKDKSGSPQMPPAEVELPDWLKAAAPKSTFYEPVAEEEPYLSKLPDWLKSAQSQPAPPGKESSGENVPAAPTPRSTASTVEGQESVPAFTAEPPSREKAAVPAFFDDALSTNDLEALFTEMPDWISSSQVEDASSGRTPSAAGDAETISAADLPSWVQAMRPVQAPIVPAGETEDETQEMRGALAGLQGVLPSVPGAEPSSKPKALSIKLQATEEQQAHAALLEQILKAEETTEPIRSSRPMANQGLLRWGIAGFLFLIVSAVLLSGTQSFRLPVGWPVEMTAALQIVEAVPENAPVLVAVDYEPARVGEMESAAVPLLDHMIVLRHPRITFVSTYPTGPVLAERLISGPLGSHKYQRGTQYSNLGYLPGGLTGVRAFAQNPTTTKALDVENAPAWNSVPLKGVSSISNFSALIIVTDDADSARTWIEQAGPYRGAVPLVIISSAQAAPMIQPYYQSQQVNALVYGLFGGVILEQNNAGRPGLARAYWDAYSLGLWFGMILIVVGGLWNLALGLRERASERGIR